MWPLWLRMVVVPIRFLALIIGGAISMWVHLAGEPEKAEAIMDWIIDFGTKRN